jgi:hypothetical protein
MPAVVIRSRQLWLVVCLAVVAARVSAQGIQPVGGNAQSVPLDDDSQHGIERFLKRIPEPDRGGGVHFTKHFAVVFGDIKDGSSVAAGPAVSYQFANGAYAQAKAVYSVRQFRLLQARYDSPQFWSGRASFSTRARWQDAPRLSLFQLGMDSPLLRASVAERKTEWSGQFITRPTRAIRIAAGAGIERFAVSGGRLDLNEDEALTEVPILPGLGVRPWFGHVFVDATFDSRASDFARSGTVVEAALHDVRDWHDGQFSFERVEGGVEQVLRHGRRSTVDLSARTWLSFTGSGRTVPFFLMPTLGGGDYLEAYRLYRFRDRNALWVKGEYRRAVHPNVDVAGFYEAGQVAPSPSALSLKRAAQGVGAGVIVHAKSSARVRLDVARGREGYGMAIMLIAGGS